MAKSKANAASPSAPTALVTPASYDQCMAVISGVDQVAATMEARWGIRRLPLIVSDDTRTRFRAACAMWAEAIKGWQIGEVTKAGGMMRRAWAALEAEAISLGHEHIEPHALEAPLPDGTVLAVVNSADDAHHIAKHAAGRKVIALTMEEVARLFQKYGREDLQTSILAEFPGATVALKRGGELPPGFAYEWATASARADLFGDDLSVQNPT